MDYTSGPYTVTFPAGQTTATFNIPITDDRILEGDEKFMLTIISSSLPTGVTRDAPSQITVTIMDDDHQNKTCKVLGMLFQECVINFDLKCILLLQVKFLLFVLYYTQCHVHIQ